MVKNGFMVVTETFCFHLQTSLWPVFSVFIVSQHAVHLLTRTSKHGHLIQNFWTFWCFRIVPLWSHVPLRTIATATCLTVQSPTMAAPTSLTTTEDSTVSDIQICSSMLNSIYLFCSYFHKFGFKGSEVLVVFVCISGYWSWKQTNFLHSKMCRGTSAILNNHPENTDAHTATRILHIKTRFLFIVHQLL